MTLQQEKNELIKDNHYSIKDVEKTDSTDQGETKSEKRSNYPGGQSSGDDSTAASCGSTPPTVEGSDDSKNSSDTDSPDNDASGNMKQDKRETEEKQHKRVHYQDHKLSAKKLKYLNITIKKQRQRRRLQRIMEMVRVIVMVQATVMVKGAVVMEAVMVMEQATNGPDQVVILHRHRLASVRQVLTTTLHQLIPQVPQQSLFK